MFQVTAQLQDMKGKNVMKYYKLSTYLNFILKNLRIRVV